MTFTHNGTGTATLAGTPVVGSQGTYSFTITASNGITPNTMQTFTLTVAPPSTTVLQPCPGMPGQYELVVYGLDGNDTITSDTQPSTAAWLDEPHAPLAQPPGQQARPSATRSTEGCGCAAPPRWVAAKGHGRGQTLLLPGG